LRTMVTVARRERRAGPMKKEPKHPRVKKVLQCDMDILGGKNRRHWCSVEVVRGRRRIGNIKQGLILAT